MESSNLTMGPADGSSLRGRKATRSTLACLPCRSRHTKCDGRRPQCSRCADFAKECHYAESRRGGVHKPSSSRRTENDTTTAILRTLDNSYQGQSRSSHHLSEPGRVEEDSRSPPPWSSGNDNDDPSPSALLSPLTPSDPSYRVENDALVDLYYRKFHRFHPIVLPRGRLTQTCATPEGRASFEPLVAVLRLIGHLYGSQEWSALLGERVETGLGRAADGPVKVQCQLLYSIALFWCEQKLESQVQMNSAIQLAVNIGMFRQEFAARHGHGDVFLVESWRRTWWMLYIIDVYYAGTLGTRKFSVEHVDATVALPCQESEYESGNISESRSLEDFNSREFYPEFTFSSFAYLIGAVKCSSAAILATPTSTNAESSSQAIHAVDAMIDGWLLMLPQERKQVMSVSGEIDELILQAFLMIHVATVGMHRPLSELRFNAVEDSSSCAREPRPDSRVSEQINVHTVRVLRAIEAQVRLLSLPVQPFSHSPFTTCAVSEGTLALLSACRFLLQGKELKIARDQIRMIIGCLKALGETWPRTARNVKEIQFIARHVLGLESSTVSSTRAPSSHEVAQPAQEDADRDSGRFGADAMAAAGFTGDICGWFEPSDLSTDISWWINDQ